MALTHFLLLVSISLLGTEGRIITLQNGCKTTIWPAFQQSYIEQNNTDASQQLANTNELTSHDFQLKPGESINITTPEENWASMIWGRQGCSFDSFGNGTCITGDCAGKLQCPRFRFPSPPNTMAFIFLNSTNDFYYISLESGFNFPMSISPYGHNGSSPCAASSCLSDINNICPSDKEVRFSDEIVGCQSDCFASDNYNFEQYCCHGTYGTCKASNYSTAVNKACPTAAINGYDLQANTLQCTGANYIVSFC